MAVIPGATTEQSDGRDVEGTAVAAASDHDEVQAFRYRLPVHGFWVVSGRSLGFIAVLIANAVLARCLSQGEFADFSVALSFIAFTSGLAVFGLEVMVVRRVSGSLTVKAMAEAARQVKGILRMARASSLLGGVGALVFLLALGRAVFGLHGIGLLAPLLAATVALVAYQQVSAETLRSLGRVHVANILTGGRPGGPAANLLFLVLLAVAVHYAAMGIDLVLTLNFFAALAAGIVAAVALRGPAGRHSATRILCLLGPRSARNCPRLPADGRVSLPGVLHGSGRLVDRRRDLPARTDVALYTPRSG